jgi:predicted nucleotide-binding protein
MSFEISCRPCAAQGYYGFDRKDTCKVCGGTARLFLPGEPDDYKKCGPCAGQGYYEFDRKDTCGVCKGLGMIVQASRAPLVRPGLEGNATPAAAEDAVFLVHGHNTTVRDRINLYISQELKLKVEVMEAEANEGRTLPEKFEEIADKCGFAVFLMTADDHLKTEEGREILRARQNVVLEIGYFWGKYGRRKRIAFLVDPALELPSDIQGFGWIQITADLAATFLKLRKELEKAGLVQPPRAPSDSHTAG